MSFSDDYLQKILKCIKCRGDRTTANCMRVNLPPNVSFGAKSALFCDNEHKLAF